jgi:hypothetical protein
MEKDVLDTLTSEHVLLMARLKEIDHANNELLDTICDVISKGNPHPDPADTRTVKMVLDEVNYLFMQAIINVLRDIVTNEDGIDYSLLLHATNVGLDLTKALPIPSK